MRLQAFVTMLVTYMMIAPLDLVQVDNFHLDRNGVHRGDCRERLWRQGLGRCLIWLSVHAGQTR